MQRQQHAQTFSLQCFFFAGVNARQDALAVLSRGKLHNPLCPAVLLWLFAIILVGLSSDADAL